VSGVVDFHINSAYISSTTTNHSGNWYVAACGG